MYVLLYGKWNSNLGQEEKKFKWAVVQPIKWIPKITSFLTPTEKIESGTVSHVSTSNSARVHAVMTQMIEEIFTSKLE